MPTDITTYIQLETIGAGFSDGREIEHIIRLDEGHDRSVWEWVQNKPKRAFMGSNWVPEGPDALLLAGLFMLAAEGLAQPEISSAVDAFRRDRGNSSTLVDLTNNPLDENLKALLADAFTSYTVNIVCLPGSGVLRQVAELDALGVSYRVLEELPVD